MSLFSSRLRLVAAGVAVLSSVQAVDAAAVAVGSSKLIGVIDYSDTWTLTDEGGVVTDRVAGGLRSPIAYTVESTWNSGNRVQWTQARTDAGSTTPRPNMSIADDTPARGLLPTVTAPYPGTSGAGSSSGFTQSGAEVSYGIPYNLRNEYIVQFDAVQSRDRINITSGATAGTVFQDASVSVLFRGPQYANDPVYSNNVTVFSRINGVDTPTNIRGEEGYDGFSTGLSTSPSAWHNYAVRFDSANSIIEIFLDEKSLVVLDLNTFAGGLYAGFSNDAVSVGGTANDRLWTDNVQMGAVPEPTTLAVFGLGAMGFLRRRR